MKVYLINSYDITDAEGFAAYPPQVSPLLAKYGAKVLASDTNAKALEGQPRTMNAIIEFPSEEAVWDCYNDPAYSAIKKIRHAATSHCTMTIVKAFEPS